MSSAELKPTLDCRRPGNQDRPGAVPPGLVEETIQRWHDGATPSADEVLKRYPSLADQEDAALRLIYEEVCLRRERGETISTVQVGQRFPRWQQQLEVLFRCHSLLS